jgi:cytochrome c oxidase subunit III
MNTVAIEQRNKIHPHKFTMWIGIASIVMMFAGLTSAYIIKRSQALWVTFDLPTEFIYSTVAIVLSSITLYMAEKAFKERNAVKYKTLVVITFLLGLLFVALQAVGFNELWKTGMTLTANVSFSFLYVIVGLHGLHVLGGIVALLVLFLKSFSKKVKNYNIVPIQVMSTYWHFVDILWIYLFIFLIMIK